MSVINEHCFLYEHCDVPQGLTLIEHRARSVSAPRRRWWQRWRRDV